MKNTKTKFGGEKSRYAKKIEKKEKHQVVHIVVKE